MTVFAAIGDPHGEVSRIDTDRADYLLITGDLGPYREARQVLGHYNDLDTPTYLVPGNHDVRHYGNGGTFEKLLNRYDNIESVDGECVTLDEEYDLAGYGAHRFYLGPESLDELDFHTNRFKGWPESYMERKETLEETLDQADSPTILLSHNVPLDSDVDVLDSPVAKKVKRRGRPWGSDVLSNTIPEYDDILLNVGGHIHEGRGVGKKDSVPVINAGQNDVTYVTLDGGQVADIAFE